MVTEEGGSEVLDGVDFSGVRDGLIVWEVILRSKVV